MRDRGCHTPGMSRTTGGREPRHERAHDPARADWHGWSAEHPEPDRMARVVDRTDLAPYASTGGHSAYSPMGSWIQTTNFNRALLADDRRAVRALGWAMVIAVLVGIGLSAGVGIWHLVELI